MREASATSASAPNGILLGLSTVAVTGVSLVAWMLIVLVSYFDLRWGGAWIYTGLALPAATIGSVVTHTTRRQSYFWVGLAITLIPLVAYVLLAATTPEPASTWVD